MDCVESKYKSLRYIKRLPKNYKENVKIPTILFLHGAGTIGTDIHALETNPFFVATCQEDFPFAVVAPLCECGVWFDHFEILEEFAHEVSKMPFVDSNKLYLVGNSMGGYGTWQLAMSKPELFAAIVPICGGGMAWRTSQLVHVPVWAFHGELDQVVFPDESKHLVEQTNLYGGNAKLTLIPNTGHNAWDYAYATKELWTWLLSNTKYSENPIKVDQMDQIIYG